LAAALSLRNSGAGVIVLEATAIGSGASANGSGLVAPALRHWTAADLERLQPKVRREFTDRLATSADAVRKLISSQQPGIAANPTGLTVREIETRVSVAQSSDLDLWSDALQRTASGASVRSAAVTNDTAVEWTGAFTLDPNMFVHDLARRCLTDGVRLYTGTPALGYGRGGLRWVVTTPEGRLDARALFVATNASATRHSGRIMPDVMDSVAVTDAWYVATRPLPPALRERILPDGHALADPSGELRSLTWTPDGALLIALRPGLRLGAQRVRASAVALLMQRFGDGVAREVASHIEYIWSTPAAITRTGVSQFHTVGPDGYAWIGGASDDIALSTMIGIEFANAMISGQSSHLALPLTEPEAIPYRRLRTLLGLSLLPKRALTD
jgi:glycine/D-amino acid oxidase-like deaminating enzyme